MGWRDRLFGPPPVTAATRETRLLRPEPGPLAAREAWALVRPAALALGADARLVWISSGLDLGADGRSFTWEFSVTIPSRQATALLTLEPDPAADDVDSAPLVQTTFLRPAGPMDRSHVPLPEPFRDSPEAVAAFAARGVDYGAGPTDMKIESRSTADGPVWVTWYWNDELTTPFAAG